MVRYEIRDVVGDHGLYEDGELKLILNSRTNAEYIKAILEHEERHPNAAVPYSPEVEAMSDAEVLAVFKRCCAEENRCDACPLRNLDDGCFLPIERRVLAIAERAVDVAGVMPKSEYDELKAELDAAIAGQATLQEALARTEIQLDEARRKVEAHLSKVCEQIKVISGLEERVRGLESELEGANDDVSTLQGTIALRNEDVDELTGRLERAAEKAGQLLTQVLMMGE